MFKYHLNLTIYNNSLIYIGRDNYFNGSLNIIAGEEKDIIIGDNCMISFGSWIRNTDPHLVYDSSTYCRINPSKSVLIGDHVWIGQSCIILKGTVVGSGSILGAGSVVSGKKFLPITAGEEILHVF